MRVLIVDDSREVQRALGTRLAAEPDVEVVGCAHDRAGALTLVAQLGPELVVLDVDLANHDRGYDVLRDIRSRYPDVAIIVLSNYTWSSMRAAFIDAGALAYFDKALEFGRAIEWIRAHVSRVATSTALQVLRPAACDTVAGSQNGP